MKSIKRVGPMMESVAAFVASNPGRSMFAAAKWVSPRTPTQTGYGTVHRAIDAGLVWAVRGANGQTRLYPLVEAA